MAKRIRLRSWRVTEADPSGSHVWFDPHVEEIRLYTLDPLTESGVLAFDERDDRRLLPLTHFKLEPGSDDPDLPF